MNIVVYADSNETIGMGHIMRSLCLANEFRKNGHKITFISKGKEGCNKIIKSGYKLHRLYTHETSKVSDIEQIKDYLKNSYFDLLIIDSYHITKIDFENIKKMGFKIAYLDDINKLNYPVDIVINGNIIAEALNYDKKYYKENQKLLLLGTKYNILRDEFINKKYKVVNKFITEILVTTGGSDSNNLTPRITNYILTSKYFSNIRINIIIGPGFTNIKDIKYLADNNSNIVLYENPKSMSKIMERSDIAISSAGNTVNELCSCGTPAIIFISSKFQELYANLMDKKGLAVNLGWYYELSKCKIENALINIEKDYSRRKEIVKNGQMFIDGLGTQRIVKEVENYLLNH